MPEPGHTDHEGGFVCSHCGATRATPLGIDRHRARCRRGQ